MIGLSRHTRRCISVRWLRSVACDIPVVRLDTTMISNRSASSEKGLGALSIIPRRQSGYTPIVSTPILSHRTPTRDVKTKNT
jgi:hypothetical protein